MSGAKPRTELQRERQRTEYRSGGRYAKVNPCELCGKSAGVDYFSVDECNSNGGFGLVLCEKCWHKWTAAPAESLAKAKARAAR